jgi:hypothetical protein
MNCILFFSNFNFVLKITEVFISILNTFALKVKTLHQP